MVRILVCGDVTDRFASVQPKLEALVAKNGPFDLVLLTTSVGSLPAPPTPLSVPTYFAALSHDRSSLPREVTENLHYVGPSAKFCISSLSFLLSSAGAPLDSLSALINNDDLSSTKFHDIAQTPKQFNIQEDNRDPNVGNTLEIVEKTDANLQIQPSPQSCVDIVVTTASPLSSDVFAAHARKIGLSTRPRYHFSAAQGFVSMPPFCYKPAKHSTRVVSIAPACKGRWAYAIDIQPLNVSLNETLTGADRHLDSSNQSNNHNFGHPKYGVYRLTGWKRPLSQGDDNVDCDSDTLAVKRFKSTEDRCWFCIGDALEPHLIVLRGEHIVATVAKGGLQNSHLVIVPAAHIESSASTGFSDETWLQLMDVLNAIARLYTKHFPGCFPYLFERSGGETEDGRIRHMHIQAVAVENGRAEDMQNRCVELARNFGVEARLQFITDESRDPVKGAKLCLELVREQHLDKFFWAQLSSNSYVVIRFSGGCAVPVHFGRMIVAEAIGDNEATDWRNRVVSAKEEGQLALRLNTILKQVVVDMKQ